MKKYFSKLMIMQKFLMIFSLVLIAVLTSYIIVFWFNAKQKTQTSQIDVAGSVRMLSQRIGMMALLMNSDNNTQADVAKEEMVKALKLLDQRLNVIRNGGLVPGNDDNIVLPKIPDSILPNVEEIDELFMEYKKITTILIEEPRIIQSTVASADSLKVDSTITSLNPKFKESINKLEELLIEGKLMSKNIELTQSLTQQAIISKNIFTLILIVLLVINVVIIAFAFFFLRTTLNPLKPITEHIAKLSEGDVPLPIETKRTDEIGKIAEALNTLSDNLGSATEFAKNVGAGELDTQIEVFKGKGYLSQSLYAMRNNLKEIAEEDRKRNWVTEGLAKFSDILRVNSDLKTFSDSIITNIVKYTGSNQGSLFIVNDTESNNVQLELLACYAFNRRKFLDKKVFPGEGLVGQAYLEKETTFLKDIPQGYIQITSGLGEASPTSLLIVPLKLNNEITGIIEIASFKEYQPHEIAFVEKLAENIASTITGVKINERTQYLLQSSQQQGEEMKAQEEEMRQNMEELSATQEEMARKEKEYISKIALLQSVKENGVSK